MTATTPDPLAWDRTRTRMTDAERDAVNDALRRTFVLPVSVAYVSATDTRGSRLQVRGPLGRRLLPFEHADRDAFEGAARRYAEQLVPAGARFEITRRPGDTGRNPDRRRYFLTITTAA